MTEGTSSSHTSEEVTTSQTCEHHEMANNKTWPTLPSWAAELEKRNYWGDRLQINEWEGYGGGADDAADIDRYREENGWKVRSILLGFLVNGMIDTLR